MLIIGVGFGGAMPALMSLGMSGATEADAGLASGMFNTSQQIGGALGLSVLAALATDETNRLESGGTDELSALTDGFHTAFLMAAGFAFAAYVVAMTVLRRRPRQGSPGNRPRPPQRSKPSQPDPQAQRDGFPSLLEGDRVAMSGAHRRRYRRIAVFKPATICLHESTLGAPLPEHASRHGLLMHGMQLIQGIRQCLRGRRHRVEGANPLDSVERGDDRWSVVPGLAKQTSSRAAAAVSSMASAPFMWRPSGIVPRPG